MICTLYDKPLKPPNGPSGPREAHMPAKRPFHVSVLPAYCMSFFLLTYIYIYSTHIYRETDVCMYVRLRRVLQYSTYGTYACMYLHMYMSTDIYVYYTYRYWVPRYSVCTVVLYPFPRHLLRCCSSFVTLNKSAAVVVVSRHRPGVAHEPSASHPP
jgi:hypothetical protein